MRSILVVAGALCALTGFHGSTFAGTSEPEKPAALDEIEIPDSDVNFGEKLSVGQRPPPTGPLLHRAFAQRWKDSFEANAATASNTISRAGAGDCGNRAQLNASGWQDVLDAAKKEAAKGQLNWATVPQIAARHYMRASNMAEKLIKAGRSAGCPVE